MLKHSQNVLIITRTILILLSISFVRNWKTALGVLLTIRHVPSILLEISVKETDGNILSLLHKTPMG